MQNQFDDRSQHCAANDVSHSLHATSAVCENLAIQVRIMERGADVDLAQADELQAGVVQFGLSLLLSVLAQPSAETVSFARREEIVLRLEQLLAALVREQGGDAAVYDSGILITIPVTMEGGGSVIFRVKLGWKDRYGSALSGIVCQSTIDVPSHERERFRSWLSDASSRLEHRDHEMAEAPSKAGAKA